MDTLRAAVCEDKQEDYERLAAALETTDHDIELMWFRDGQGLLDAYATNPFDLVFLDVFMEGVTGVEAAARIREVDANIPIAFVTTSRDFALEGYRHHVDRYIQKPYLPEEIAEYVSFAALRLQAAPGIVVRGERIPHARIRYVEQRNHTSILHLVGGRDVSMTGKLDDLEKALPTPPFYRCHKSFLVNLDFVEWLNRDLNTFEMIGGGNAYVRRTSIRQAQRALDEHVFGKARRMGVEGA